MNALQQRIKVAQALIKVGLAAPPAAPGAGYDDIPNGANDLDTDPDKRRMAGPSATHPSHYLRRTRVPGRVRKTAAESAAGPGPSSAATSGSISTTSTKAPGEQKHLKFDSSTVMGGKPRASKADALKLRPFVDGIQYDKMPRGVPELDPKFPSAKVACLLRLVGLCR